MITDSSIFESFEANSKEKTSANLKYFIKIEVGILFAINIAICALQER